MGDELWIKQLKERLKDYSESPSPTGWERLERELSPAAPVNEERRQGKYLWLRRWSMGAAAALLAGISLIGLWFIQSPVSEEVGTQVERTLSPVASNIPVPSKPDVVIRRKTLVAQHIQTDVADEKSESIKEGIGYIEENQSDKEVDVVFPNQGDNSLSDGVDKLDATGESASEQTLVRNVPDKPKSTRHYPYAGSYQPIKQKEYGRWSVAFSVGNVGGMASGNNAMSADIQQSPNAGVLGNRIDLTTMADGAVAVYEDQELVFENGVPYLRSGEQKIASVDHKMPVSVGISVRKELPRGFSVETGLVYTFLSSDIRYENSVEELSQKLHYLGIPLRANWSFVRTSLFDIYVSAGGMVEKCVYGKLGTESQTVKPVQWSVMGNIGVQYNIGKRVGIYVEPGVSYFFDDGSSVQTIRKENPCNFTLQAGLRLTY